VARSAAAVAIQIPDGDRRLLAVISRAVREVKVKARIKISADVPTSFRATTSATACNRRTMVGRPAIIAGAVDARPAVEQKKPGAKPGFFIAERSN
jgi:hypothetical protein